ncbi:MAG TPA: adenylosuccinate synthetase, partial [Dongiaceae bacterium]|nr:adenylosuccinate synthetase [Dongiaceae bacterium]
ALIERGVAIEGRLLVSDRANLVLPYHKLLDAESARSRQIGTTSRGIGPAYEDKIGRRGVRVGDLRHPEIVADLGVPGIKAALDLIGLPGGPARAPLAPLDARQKGRVAELVAAAGLRATPAAA